MNLFFFGNMQVFFFIKWIKNLREISIKYFKICKRLISAIRYAYFFLQYIFLQHNNNIFLQNRFILKCFTSRLKQMDMFYCTVFQNKLTKRFVINTITKASWNNSNNMPQVFSNCNSGSDKGSV